MNLPFEAQEDKGGSAGGKRRCAPSARIMTLNRLFQALQGSKVNVAIEMLGNRVKVRGACQ